MQFFERVLQPPSYGYAREGKLYVPSTTELFREFRRRTNLWRTRKHWLACFSWSLTLAQVVPLAFFVTRYFSWSLFLAGFIYSMVIMGTHGTVWYHRYATHRAFQFQNAWWRFVIKNLVIKVVPDELYIVSHHVHHLITERPGDPYNVHGGWLYCFLADAVHQPIATDLSREDYHRVRRLLGPTGMHLNTYEQYRTWGSVSSPGYTIAHVMLNWLVWYGVFYLIGGHALACALFASAGVWGIGIRTFNYDGHGGGKDRRKDGVDFDRSDLSINQLWPGLITGEWHNNHHLYPKGARAGFLRYQLDPAWCLIVVLDALGGIAWYRDYRQEFLAKHYQPHLVVKETVAD